MKEQKSDTHNKLLFKTDRRICGEYQIPATLYEQLSNDPQEAAKLARGRVAVASGTSMEIMGRSLATLGLSKESSPVFAIGTALYISGGLMRAHARARNGSRWEQLLLRTITTLGPHKKALEASLVAKGIAEEEIDSLATLPKDIYMAEGHHPNLDRMKYVLTPIGSGIGIAATGDFITGSIVGGLGLSAFPLGEKSYKASEIIRAAQFRVARSANHKSYIEKISQRHNVHSDILNVISYTPETTVLGAYLWEGGKSTLLPAFYGVTTGLQGLTLVLTLQKQREKARRSTEIATHLIEAISNKPFIATPQRWKEHIAAEEITVFNKNVPFANGIVIKNFVAQSPSGENAKLAPITIDVPANGAVVFRGASGIGKSIMFMGLMHLLEHQGSVHLIKEGKNIDVHTLPGPDEVAEEILFISEDGINRNDRIVDLFRHYFKKDHAVFYESHLKKYDKTAVEVAWTVADNLLEKEIEKIRESEVSVFPSVMVNDLEDIRDYRKKWVTMHLHRQKGNIVDIGTERVFSTLSSGEKQRMLVAIADVASQVEQRTAVILDEPLANLDEDNKKLQIDILRKIQEKNSVALLIVSHQDIDDLHGGLNTCKVVDLEQNGL